ncbi:MAG: EamA family transporter [Proteobacteria bacterium]|nr:EamA family transporter [Pseudomonadota bacterium]
MNTRLLPLLCLAAAVLLWGTSFVAMKVALTGFPPLAVVFLRMALASGLMALFWNRVPKAGCGRGDLKWLVLVCLFQPCLYFLLESFAISLTTSSQAGMISSLVPLLVAAGAWMFLGERLSARNIGGIVLSLVGVAWLSLTGQVDEHAPNPALGNLLELLAMCCAASYMLLLKHLSSRFNPWHLTGLQAFAGVVFFLPGALLSGQNAWFFTPLQVPAEAWLAVCYLGGIVTLGGFGLYNMAVAQLPAAQAAASINLVPVVAVLSGWVLLGETMVPAQAAACAVILAGVLLGQGKTKG